jgi:hypothetical protein
MHHGRYLLRARIALKTFLLLLNLIFDIMPAVAERLRRAYPAPLGRAGVGSIPTNPRRTKRAFFPPLAI